ncbi:MAG: DUF1499 domain-containing protein [Planctomycetaceae bacterium]|nr:DUF1499 domain-containing protein [Planctomycetaceae bacterium]
MWGLVIFIAVLFVAFLVVRGLPSQRPESLGLLDGTLRSCPDKPNCVCSVDSRPEHTIDPIKFAGDGSEQWQRLVAAIKSDARAKVVTQTNNYLHAEFTTPLFQFVDDLELHLDRQHNTIHIRSASRTGHSDLGVNRARVARLLKQADIGG